MESNTSDQQAVMSVEKSDQQPTCSVEKSHQQPIMPVEPPPDATSHKELSPQEGMTQPLSDTRIPEKENEKADGKDPTKVPPKEPHPYTRCWRCGGQGHIRAQCPTKPKHVDSGRGGSRGARGGIRGRAEIGGQGGDIEASCAVQHVAGFFVQEEARAAIGAGGMGEG
ncbi:uncharacterized protein [Montipora capricornis]|uniref:uncharacterized protein n=1 Tax=Montipora capricornis TaxID=246305 RepID=UPI0035F1BF4F